MTDVQTRIADDVKSNDVLLYMKVFGRPKDRAQLDPPLKWSACRLSKIASFSSVSYSS